MRNCFIIHGTFGHNKENWFGWLEETLKSKGFEVYNFNYPNTLMQVQVLQNLKTFLTIYNERTYV